MVTNDEYEKAYKNIDNIKIIKSASKKYSKAIDPSDLESIIDNALWKALENYDESRGKFTTWLYSYVNYACRRYLYAKKKKKGVSLVHSDMALDNFSITFSGNIDDIIEKLDDDQKELIRYRFVDNMTLAEIGKLYDCTNENIRLRLAKIYEILKAQNDV